GTAGMIVGYAGPVFVVGGALMGISGMMQSVGGAATENQQQSNDGASQALGGLVMVAGGFSMNFVGPALLSSSSMVGASAVQSAGGNVGVGAGWAAVAGSGVQLLSLAGRFGDNGGLAWTAGVAGWGTGMIAGTIQHVQNRNAWTAMGTSRAPVERKHFTIAFAPTSNGARVFGTF
ncbi:MAG TPA: hypothetical protein DFR83_24015, partial [Deltaproteobacteria bacterium]|nr:hypothetical protein [Deltaproteobacteria bacterium]